MSRFPIARNALARFFCNIVLLALPTSERFLINEADALRSLLVARGATIRAKGQAWRAAK